MSLEDFITKRLRTLGKTARAASMEVGDRPDLLRSLMRGDKPTNPTHATLEKAAKALKVPVEMLVAAAAADDHGLTVEIEAPPLGERRRMSLPSLPEMGPFEFPEEFRRAAEDALRRGVDDDIRRTTGDSMPPLARIALPTDRRDRDREDTIPIKGTAAGAVVADSQGFTLSDEVIERIPAPPGLSDVHGVYGIYVVGESMMPITGPGDLQIVHSRRVPRVGDLVIVKLRGHAGAAGQCYIKRFAKTSGEHLFFEQTNPVASMRVMRETVEFVHRVLTINEIFGV